MLSSLKEMNKLPNNGTVVKTIVTTEMASKIAESFGVQLIDVLTGFKYIGEKIKEFEENNKNTYLIGFEESYGYLAGTFVRDKDAVIAATLISEMALWYKIEGKTLYEGLIELYKKYGYYKEGLLSINLEGKEGMETITKIMNRLRNLDTRFIGDNKIAKVLDYKEGLNNLPKSNVLKFLLKDQSWFVVRPSGTEPKIKMYVSVVGENLKDADCKLDALNDQVMSLIKHIIAE